MKVMRGIGPHRARRSRKRRLAGFFFDLTLPRSALAIAWDRRSVKKGGILFLAACLIVIWPGAGIAHWQDSVNSEADAATGYTGLTFDGVLDLGIEPCEPGGSESDCVTSPVDQDEFPRLDLSTESVEILSWINAPGDTGDPLRVGFMFRVTGGVADVTVHAAATDFDLLGVEEGVHTWLPETCQDNGVGTIVCDSGTPALDSVTLCLTVDTTGSCPAAPLVSAVLRNDGSAPLTVDLELGEALVTPADGFCDLHRLDVSLAVGDPSDIVYTGDPCVVDALASLPLGVLDPGAVFDVHLTGEVPPDFDPAFYGTTIEFDLQFEGNLWNTPAWTATANSTAAVTIDGIAPPAPDVIPESTERIDPTPPAVAPPEAEPPSAKPPAVEPPVKPPEQEPAPPTPPDEEPPTPEPPTEPEPVPPPDDTPPVEPPPEEPPVTPPPEEPPPPPEDPPPPEEPPPPAEPVIGYVQLGGYDDRIEGTAASSGRGDLTLVMLVNVAEWATGEEQILFSHWGNAIEDRSFLVVLTEDGAIELDVYDGGFVSYVTEPVTYEDGDWRWLRVHLDANSGNTSSVLEVSTSDEPETSPFIDVEWAEPDLTVTMNRTVTRNPARDRMFKIGGHGTHAPTEMDVGLVALMAEMQPGNTEVVFGSDWRADGAFTGNPPSRPDDAVPEIEWRLEGRDIEHVPSALAFVDWLPSVVLAAAPALSTATRTRTRRQPTKNSAGKPGMAGIARQGEVMPGF